MTKFAWPRSARELFGWNTKQYRASAVRSFSLPVRLHWLCCQAHCFARQKAMRAPMDCMLGQVIGGSATLVMSDSLKGRCGENGHCERHPRTRARHETF